MRLDDALNEIRSCRERLAEASDPSTKIELARELATYNAYLADEMASLHKQATDATARAYRGYKKAGVSDTGAGEKARFDSTGEREIYENIQFVYKSTESLIKILQSEVRVKENQISREGSL